MWFSLSFSFTHLRRGFRYMYVNTCSCFLSSFTYKEALKKVTSPFYNIYPFIYSFFLISFSPSTILRNSGLASFIVTSLIHSHDSRVLRRLSQIKLCLFSSYFTIEISNETLAGNCKHPLRYFIRNYTRPKVSPHVVRNRREFFNNVYDTTGRQNKP